MRDLERRLKAAEMAAKGGAVPIISEKTGRILGYMHGADALHMLFIMMREETAVENGEPVTEPITDHPLWPLLAQAAPFHASAGSLVECVRREARTWADERDACAK